MPIFQYSALDGAGRRTSGTIESPSKDLALEKLREEGLVPLAVEVVKEPSTVEDMIARWRPIPNQTLVYFFRQLATMIDAGMSPMRSLSTLEEGEDNPKFREVISSMISSVEAGTPLHIAMAENREIFSRLMIAMIRAGEESGSLADALQALAEQLEKNETIRRAVKSAMIYPKVLLGISFFIVSGLLLFVVPRFAEIFKGLTEGSGAELPLPTRILIFFSELLYPPGSKDLLWFLSVGVRFLVLGAIIFGIAKLVRWLLEQPGPRANWDSWKLRAPMRIGPIVQKITVARFSRTFASLMQAGVPAVEALDIVADTSGNVLVASAVLEAREQMLAGSPMSETLLDSGVFPPAVVRMIEIGEETGRIEEMLLKIADFYEEEVALAIRGLTSVIEPLMVLVVGSIIGAIVIAIYLPLLQIYQNIGGGAAAFLLWKRMR